MSLVLSVSRAAFNAATAPARAVGALIDEGRAVERRARTALTATAGRVALDTLDETLTRLFSDQVVDRVLAHIESAGLAQRVVDRLLDDGVVEQISERVIEGPEFERVLSNVANSDRVQDAIVRAVDSEAVERLIARLIASPGSERVVALVLESPLLTEAVTGLLESEELWILVDEIARSPSVTEAISHQGMGFADQVAGELRDRSRGADAWLERTARRLRRRHDDAAPSANGAMPTVNGTVSSTRAAPVGGDVLPADAVPPARLSGDGTT